MKNEIVIFGAGGHSYVVWDAVVAQELYRPVAFTDVSPKASQLHGLPVIQQTEILKLGVKRGVLAIGDNALRLKVASEVLRLIPDFEFVTIIHPRATIAKEVKLGAGTVVLANAVINCAAVTGAHCVINTAAVVEHECVLGDGTTVAPNSAIAGNVKIGERSYIGIGSCVIQGISIGDDTMIGAGSVVVEDMPASVTAFGNPCRVVRKNS